MKRSFSPIAASRRVFAGCAILAGILSLQCCTQDRLDTSGNGPELSDAQKQEEKHGISYLYDSSVVPEIHVSVPVDEWNTLLKAYDANSNTKQAVRCDVKYIKDDEVTEITDASIRLRGNTSRRRPSGHSGEEHQKDETKWRHCHYQINFHKYIKDDGHKVHGAKKVILKWFKDDPAYVRELFCYDLFRRFGVWTASHSTYCRLYIHIEGDTDEVYLGVYNMIEPVDDTYLKVRNTDGHFGSSDGFLWKCRYGTSLATAGADFGPDTGTDQDHTYELKTNTENFDNAKTQIKDFIVNLNTLKGDAFKRWLESVCDVEMLLRTYAVNVAVGMWDDYWNNKNNYYLYFNSTDPKSYKVWFIPYDYDNTLGTTSICGVQSDAGTHDPFNWGSSDNPWIYKVLQIPEFREIYRQALLDLVDENKALIHCSAATMRVRLFQAKIREYVPNDTGEDMTLSDRPASWSNHSEYRIMDASDEHNFFRKKAESVHKYCGEE